MTGVANLMQSLQYIMTVANPVDRCGQIRVRHHGPAHPAVRVGGHRNGRARVAHDALAALVERIGTHRCRTKGIHVLQQARALGPELAEVKLAAVLHHDPFIEHDDLEPPRKPGHRIQQLAGLPRVLGNGEAAFGQFQRGPQLSRQFVLVQRNEYESGQLAREVADHPFRPRTRHERNPRPRSRAKCHQPARDATGTSDKLADRHDPPVTGRDLRPDRDQRGVTGSHARAFEHRFN